MYPIFFLHKPFILSYWFLFPFLYFFFSMAIPYPCSDTFHGVMVTRHFPASPVIKKGGPSGFSNCWNVPPGVYINTGADPLQWVKGERKERLTQHGSPPLPLRSRVKRGKDKETNTAEYYSN